jgi:hypothetical protein
MEELSRTVRAISNRTYYIVHAGRSQAQKRIRGTVMPELIQFAGFLMTSNPACSMLKFILPA